MNLHPYIRHSVQSNPLNLFLTSLVAQMVKCLPTVRETRVQFLGQEDLLDKGMATHSSILAHPPHPSPQKGLKEIFCPTSFQRQWAAFLGAWYPLPAFRSCFVVFAQRSNDCLINLWGRKWSHRPIPPPS